MATATVLPAPRDIARIVSIQEVLRQFRWRMRSRSRADCGLCHGRSSGTVAYTHHVWHCHRCKEGGDVFSLVRAVNCCDFPQALCFVAELAGIRLEGARSVDFHRTLITRKRQQERVQTAANKLSALEHVLLHECRGGIHKAERTRLKVSARLAELYRGEPERFRSEHDRLWLTLQAAAALLRTELPAYTLLSFGAPAKRARFVLHPEGRHDMIWDVLLAGGLLDGEGRWVEVPA